MSAQGLWQIYVSSGYDGKYVTDLLANKQRAVRAVLGIDAGFPFTGGREAYHFEIPLRGDSENGDS